MGSGIFIRQPVYNHLGLNNPQKDYKINNSRINHMLSGNKEEATHMGLWDKFCDLFRPEKKADVLENMYNLLYPHDSSASVNDNMENAQSKNLNVMLHAFHQLKSMALEKDVFQCKCSNEYVDGDRTLKFTFSIRGNEVVTPFQLSPTPMSG
ncbi:hypothetical protein GQM18_25450, partial [Escherichia coli]|nr:hypothetical protein [Escherichia coli]